MPLRMRDSVTLTTDELERFWAKVDKTDGCSGALMCSACDGSPCCETSDPANRPNHDDQCEAELVIDDGYYSWSNCACAERAAA